MSLRTPVLLSTRQGFFWGGICPPLVFASPLGFGLPPLGFGLPPLGFGLPSLGFGLPPLDMLRFLFYTQSIQAFIKALMTQ